jgi:hypothetical protein
MRLNYNGSSPHYNLLTWEHILEKYLEGKGPAKGSFIFLDSSFGKTFDYRQFAEKKSYPCRLVLYMQEGW